MTATTKTRTHIAHRLVLTGRVQGVGLRPAIARRALELELTGQVSNTSQGVVILIEGEEHAVRLFEKSLSTHLPDAANLQQIDVTPVEPAFPASFTIVASSSEGTLATAVPQDLVVCTDCLAEIANPADRRYQYPFTSCTNCGPRYTLIESLPYDRAQTTMSHFSMCPQCQQEYESPSNRRFHSQTNACPKCGPHVWYCDASGNRVAEFHSAIEFAASAIKQGSLIALKGLGGYQLLVDATHSAAVNRLRTRKKRFGKPLAVMAKSLAHAEELVQLSDKEREVLSCPAGPILIASAKTGTRLAPEVAPGLNCVGVMLPTTPLHWLLLEACKVPLVVTSGNREGEPIAYESSAAREKLSEIPDGWLEHNRAIQRPIDDSVIRVMADRPVTIRLGRGLAPLALNLNAMDATLALGGHQKTALSICNQSQTVLGPHIGDLNSVASRERFLQQKSDLLYLYETEPVQLISDQHPDYFTTRYAVELSSVAVSIQHHHAHIVSGMLEHDWLDRAVLGIAFDGTGFGTDETIWGGEFLITTATDYQRIGHLRPFRLPGGEQAIHEPWRIALSLVAQTCGNEVAASLPFDLQKVHSLLPILVSDRFSPVTTSAGRLFDGVAALILNIEESQFEGQAAMLLESASNPETTGLYEFGIQQNEGWELDWRPVIQALLHDKQRNTTIGEMAMRFHRGLAKAVYDFSSHYSHLPVVLWGGVFQNRLLVELIQAYFVHSDQPLGIPGIIPPNDGGLSAGQLAIALARLQQTTTGGG